MVTDVSLGAHLIAHRGWNTAFPENSLPALAAALAVGADQIEFDLRLTADGVPVLCHDETVDRVSDLSGPVGSFTASELQRAQIRMPTGEFVPGLGFTTLESVLEVFLGIVGLNIHVKEVMDPRTLLLALSQYDLPNTTHDVYVSGTPELLQVALDVSPNVPRCCLDSANDPTWTIPVAADLKCSRVQFRRGRYTATDVRNALDMGLVPNLYYADDVNEAEQALMAGILGLLTNDVGPVATHLRDRGLRTTPTH